ncbi:RNA polymerase sigma factor [Velocimicrobium porci]|mgnify:CR=1 FL=1|uniref:RNA polymerase sigma factor n=1 Tax=Velocimicrobium porci TaxID=2606634 RepID=A0A6L5XUJ4_9FIRM|nr:RNA polymerase sigma factor [Velocimicrobium porci]MSS62480.1 RNA polymerase sigma factor [Velocimicrobium porci]
MKRKMEEAVQKKLIEHYDKYYRLAYSYAHNEADALDIVQESAYKAILKSDSIKKEEYIDTWIYRIVINTAVDLLRSRQKESLEVYEEDTGVYDKYEEYDLKQAIERLDPEDKSVVVLKYFEELKLDEIAAITNENVNTVKSRLYRALKKLRVQLEV